MDSHTGFSFLFPSGGPYSSESLFPPQDAYGVYSANLTSTAAIAGQHTPSMAVPATTSQRIEGQDLESYNNDHVSTPMSPPLTKLRKRKAPTLRADDWEPYKHRILELHLDQGVTLKELVPRIETEFGFTATERQYRTRITQWGKDKNIKRDEMRAIVRKQQRRNLTQKDKRPLEFTVRGNIVGPQKIERWMKRNNVAPSSLYAPSPEASTPSVVGCCTISELGSPAPSLPYSPGAPTLVTNYPQSMPPPVSPALSIQSIQSMLPPPSPSPSFTSIIRPQDSTFTGQSPALAYRTLTNTSTMAQIPSDRPAGFDYGSATPVPRRYLQDEEEILRGELEDAEASLGPDHPKTLETLMELNNILIYQGRYAKAEEVIRRVVKSRQINKGDNDVDTLEALGQLGHLFSIQGLYAKAENLLQKTLKMMRALSETKHTLAFLIMRHIADTLYQLRKHREAEEIFLEILEKGLPILGKSNLVIWSSMSGLGLIYTEENQLSRARDLLEQVMTICKAEYGEEELITLATVRNFARINRLLGRINEAERLAVQTYGTSKRIAGDDHPETLEIMYELGQIYLSQELLKKAEELGKQSLEYDKKVRGREHPFTLRDMAQLSEVWYQMGNYNQGFALAKECFDLCRKVLGPGDVRTIHTGLLLTKLDDRLTKGHVF